MNQPEPGLQGVDGQTHYMAGMPCQDWRRNPQPVESLGDEPIRKGDVRGEDKKWELVGHGPEDQNAI